MFNYMFTPESLSPGREYTYNFTFFQNDVTVPRPSFPFRIRAYQGEEQYPRARRLCTSGSGCGGHTSWPLFLEGSH